MSTLYVDNLQPNLGSQVEIPDLKPLAGSVLQVVSVYKSDTFSTASTSFTDMTDMSVTITPTNSSSKFLVTANLAMGVNTAVFNYFRMVRGSTPINVGDAAGSRVQVSGMAYGAADGQMNNLSSQYLDSPASSSAITYKIQVRSATAGTSYYNRSSRDSAATGYDMRGTSSLTVMEIAQ